MNILILTGRYLPKMSPNGVCINNIIHCLIDSGHKVTCVCYDDKLSYTNEKIEIVRIPRDFINELQYKLEDDNSRKTSVLKKICKWIKKIDTVLHIPIWPWLDPYFTRREYIVAKQIVENKNIDAIIAVHMPLSSIIVGARLKKKYPHIKFYPYFLDSLSGGRPLSLFSVDWNTKKKLAWEKKLLPYADKIIVMNSSKAHHEKYSKNLSYYERFMFLDIPLLKKIEQNNLDNPFDDNFINIVFCGTANTPMRNIQYFSLLAKELRTTKIKFTIIGECNCINLLQENNIEYIAFIPHEELLRYLANADAFINFGVRTPSAISGKIFEYMAYGKPIISTFSIDNEACIPYLKKYPAALLIDERENNVKAAADKLRKFIDENGKRELDMSLIYQIYQDNLPESFVQKLRLDEKGMLQ